MSHQRSTPAGHPRRGRRESPRSPGDHPTERKVDESLEESFPASDPPAHAKDLPPVEGERDPEDDDVRAPDDAEGGIGGTPPALDDVIDKGED